MEKVWIVLRCASSKTLPLMRRLNDDEQSWEPVGAWSPIWKRRRRLPRSSATRLMELPAIPSFVFVPADRMDDLPVLPALPYSLMRIEGVRDVRTNLVLRNIKGPGPLPLAHLG